MSNDFFPCHLLDEEKTSNCVQEDRERHRVLPRLPLSIRGQLWVLLVMQGGRCWGDNEEADNPWPRAAYSLVKKADMITMIK